MDGPKKYLVKIQQKKPTFEIGGKFSGIVTEFDKDYLSKIQEIGEDEMDKVSEIGINYNFLGSKTRPEDSDQESDAGDPDSGDDEIDDLLNSI